MQVYNSYARMSNIIFNSSLKNVSKHRNVAISNFWKSQQFCRSSVRTFSVCPSSRERAAYNKFLVNFFQQQAQQKENRSIGYITLAKESLAEMRELDKDPRLKDSKYCLEMGARLMITLSERISQVHHNKLAISMIKDSQWYKENFAIASQKWQGGLSFLEKNKISLTGKQTQALNNINLLFLL